MCLLINQLWHLKEVKIGDHLIKDEKVAKKKPEKWHCKNQNM